MEPVTQVVLVGHCGPDTFMLRSKIKQVLPEVKILSINTQSDLNQAANSASLFLVNRVLDGQFNETNGIDLIGSQAKLNDPPRMLLISNFPDAQQAAQASGALPGFGKSALGLSETETKLRQAAGYAN